MPPAGRDHREELELWANVLEPVPEMLLEGTFWQAVHKRPNGYRIAPLDVLAVYNTTRASEGDDREAHKVEGWQALAESDSPASDRYIRSMTPCEFPGCETECYSRYCMEHGDLWWHLRELNEKYQEAGE